MEDSDGPAAPGLPVEPLPRRHVGVVGVAGELLQIVERAPILNQRRSPAVEEKLATQEALLRVLVQLPEHRPHGSGRREPFPDRQGTVYEHPYNENDEGLVHPGGKPARHHLGHTKLLLLVV